MQLSLVRLIAVFGDGGFQAALGGTIVFSPERHSDPVAIAGGFAVLLLPYSVIGPFAGAMLDRWDRRAVLIWANLVRAGFIGLAALALWTSASNAMVLLPALGAVGTSRFVLAGVTASVPLVTPLRWLVATNSVLVTVGSAVTALGAGCSVAVLSVFDAGDRAGACVAAATSVASFAAAAVAARFAPGALGPERHPAGTPAEPGWLAVARGLRSGAATVWSSVGASSALLAIGAHRIVFGADTLLMVLVLRGSGAGAGQGLAGFGAAVGLTAAGMLVAAVTTPLVLPRLGRARTLLIALALALLVQVALVSVLRPTALLVAAAALGFAGQTVKLTGDATLQLDVDDAHRGRVFALQDAVFNIAFVGALAGAAALVPADGHAPAVALAVAGAYALALPAVAANERRRPRLTAGGGSPPRKP